MVTKDQPAVDVITVLSIVGGGVASDVGKGKGGEQRVVW
jgi:hypothetical protein